MCSYLTFDFTFSSADIFTNKSKLILQPKLGKGLPTLITHAHHTAPCMVSSYHENQYLHSLHHIYIILINRIRQLNWITCKHLEVALNERDRAVRDLVYAAINGKR